MVLRPDPLKELLDLQERMNRLFDETLGRERLDPDAGLHGAWLPAADVLETPDAYVVEVELPGVGHDEIEVQAQGDELLVRGERRSRHAPRPDVFHRMERRHGAFARSFRFPEQVVADQVNADFADGLLRLTVPKARARAHARVPVERS